MVHTERRPSGRVARKRRAGPGAALHSPPHESCVRVRMRGRPVTAMVAAGVAATGVLLAVALSVHWFPTPASTRAHQVRTLYDVLLIVSVPIFVTVCVV